MTPQHDDSTLRLAIPKGRMEVGVLSLMRDAGIQITSGAREYRPSVSLPDVDAKMLKPQNIIGMLEAGARDLGFAGADWVAELEADVVDLLDTRLDPVRLVAAAPRSLLEDGKLPNRPLVVASEYARLTERWMRERGLEGRLLRTFGATEVFPPEDADCIVDNTATGSTLKANALEIVDELLTSSTRLYANPRALENPALRERIERIVMLLGSVLEARTRVMIDLNVTPERLEAVVDALPCMRQPTVSPLGHEGGYAVRAAVPRAVLATVVPELKARGATDIVVSSIAQIIA
jgi:ATP phosphoribosyltransferase